MRSSTSPSRLQRLRVLPLARPFPNPAGAEGAWLRFFVPQRAASATLDVFDVSGRLVRTLVHRGGASGERVAYFDGRDGAGREVATGVYVVRLAFVGPDGIGSRQQKLSLVR